jgi:hypothetical protein
MDPKTNGVQGEGNYDATRRYNEGLSKSVEKGDSDELAEKAKKALEGPEGEELREAEEIGKQGANEKKGANKLVSK